MTKHTGGQDVGGSISVSPLAGTHVVRGSRSAAATWFLTGGVLALLMLMVAIDSAGIINLKGEDGHSPNTIQAILFALGSVYCFLAFKKIARMRGTTVSFSDTSVLVREWFGRVYAFDLTATDRIDRRFHLGLPWFGGVDVPLPFADGYRICHGKYETFLCPQSVSERDFVQALSTNKN